MLSDPSSILELTKNEVDAEGKEGHPHSSLATNHHRFLGSSRILGSVLQSCDVISNANISIFFEMCNAASFEYVAGGSVKCFQTSWTMC